jgi:protein XagA
MYQSYDERLRPRACTAAAFSVTRTGSRRARASSVLVMGLAALVAGPCLAGAWGQDEGAALVILKASHSDGGAVYNSHGQRQNFPDAGRSRQDQLNLYAEYGFSADLTLVGNFYFSKAGYRNDSGYGNRHTTGWADQEVGLRYRLNPDGDGPWQGAAQVLALIPGYRRQRPPPERDRPALGQGDYGAELRYSVGRGYRAGSRDGYVDLGAAVRLRGGDSADEARVDISSGLALAPRWMLIGEFNVIQSLGNGNGPNPVYAPGTPIRGNNYDLSKLQASLLHTLPGGTQLQLGYQQPVAGRNTGGAGGPFVAAWWRF